LLLFISHAQVAWPPRSIPRSSWSWILVRAELHRYFRKLGYQLLVPRLHFVLCGNDLVRLCASC
jgi:hypothetical protein